MWFYSEFRRCGGVPGTYSGSLGTAETEVYASLSSRHSPCVRASNPTTPSTLNWLQDLLDQD
jgi:hypothetical protein